MGYSLAEEKPHQEYLYTIQESPEWRGKTDKEIVQLVLDGKADKVVAAEFVFARKVKKTVER